MEHQQFDRWTVVSDEDIPIAEARAKAALIPIRAAKSMTGLCDEVDLAYRLN
jgi:hypothetical protein